MNHINNIRVIEDANFK